jgi:hypothetical protein
MNPETPNRAALDAGRTVCLHIGRPRPGASEHRRWTPMTDWLQASGSPMYYTVAGTNQGTRVCRVQVRP